MINVLIRLFKGVTFKGKNDSRILDLDILSSHISETSQRSQQRNINLYEACKQTLFSKLSFNLEIKFVKYLSDIIIE